MALAPPALTRAFGSLDPGATEDAAWRSLIAFRKPSDGAGRRTYLLLARRGLGVYPIFDHVVDDAVGLRFL